jgi:hypothetical protein
VERKLAYPHRHQTRLRGLDEPQTELAVINEEEDSDTEASGSWAAPIPRYDNHEVGPMIDVWAEKETMASLSAERNCRKLFSGDKEGPPLRHLKQMHAAQDVGIKLRPTAVNLTTNDRFCFAYKFAGRRGQVPGGSTPGADAKRVRRTQRNGTGGVRGIYGNAPFASSRMECSACSR